MSLYCKIVQTIFTLTGFITLQAGTSLALEASYPSQKDFSNSQILARYDQDGDGRIILSEFPSSPERFAQLDQNGDGSLTLDELPHHRVYPALDRGRQSILNMLNDSRL